MDLTRATRDMPVHEQGIHVGTLSLCTVAGMLCLPLRTFWRTAAVSKGS